MPGHPVPINKEGNACMHMQRDNEGIRLPKLLGLAVAGATLLAGMVVLPATQASAATDYGFTAEDDFVAGDLDTTKVPQLTVTKYLSLGDSYAPTGSAKDVDQLNKNNDLTPAKGILFKVTEVQPLPGKSWADIDAKNDTTYTPKEGTTPFAGVTDGHGVIDTWYSANSDGSVTIDSTTGNITGTKAAFPTGPNHYYILSEDQDHSPAFSEDNPHKLDKKNYKPAQNSFFGLPYATNGSDQDKTRGFIYHLHLYPKNMNSQQFAKTVQSVKGPNKAVKNQTTATAGDTITYKLSQKIYNDGSNSATNDGKLDIKELAGKNADVRLADRMSSSLKGDPSTIKAYIRGIGSDAAPVELTDTTDFSKDIDTNKNPARLNDPTQKMFADAPSTNVTYWVFNFFTATGVSKVKSVGTPVMELEVTYDALVTGDGDSTGTGGVVNDAASDFSDNRNTNGDPQDPVPSHTNVTNAVLAFGSVQSDHQNPKYGALPGTEYRLVKDDSSTDKYLGSDGNFYGSQQTPPEGVQIYKATANDKGLVVFAGLPIFETGTKAADKTVQNTSWKLVETKTPDDWRNPGVPFGTVTFGDVGLTEEAIVQKYGNNATLQPDYSKLSFGHFDVPVGSVPADSQMQFNNVAISKYLAHYKTNDADAPLALPLTGGRGILLLLVVGALIMGGALYARNRRNNAARA